MANKASTSTGFSHVGLVGSSSHLMLNISKSDFVMHGNVPLNN